MGTSTEKINQIHGTQIQCSCGHAEFYGPHGKNCPLGRVEENQPSSNGSSGFSNPQEIERDPPEGWFELFNRREEKIVELEAKLANAREEIDEVREAKVYILEKLQEAKEERDRLIFENERLKTHIRDLNSDLEGAVKEMVNYRCPSCEGGQ